MTAVAPHGLRALSATTEQLLDSSPDGVVIIDETGVICLVNRQAEALFGYGRSELLGRQLDMLVPDRVRASHSAQRASYFANPTTRPMGAELELAARRKDGSEFPVDISLSSLETEDGVLVLAAVRDITDRKYIESERAQLEARLLRAQHDEERAVLQAQLHQSHRLESLGQLAGGVAHDFNNLLAGIMNYTALVAGVLEEQTARLGLEGDEAFIALAQDVGEIDRIATRAAGLTRQLLIFSRREVVKPEVLDLNSIVVEMEKLLRATIGENVDLGVAVADVPWITGDRGQVEQVLMNLVVNARDAVAAGGMIRITTSRFEADDDYAQTHSIDAGTYGQLTVSDTGSGMSREVASRAYEPFFTTKPKGEGAGLGLATVYGIATQSGGDVVLYSEQGLGTAIRVHFPAAQDDAAPLRDPVEGGSLASRGETILLVEDEEMVRTSARRMLERGGYVVFAASNATEAEKVARDHPHELALLLTDVVMPGRSGKELAADILALRPATKVLYMSGYSADVIAHRGVLEAGVQLIEKPFPAESLLRRIRDVLDDDS